MTPHLALHRLLRLRIWSQRSQHDGSDPGSLTSMKGSLHRLDTALHLQIDTACSSSISALHAAVRSLEVQDVQLMGRNLAAFRIAARGRCLQLSLRLPRQARFSIASRCSAAGASAFSEVLHGPSSFMLRSVAGMLSPDGRCKTFDATADGPVAREQL